MRTICTFVMTGDPFTAQMPEGAIIRHVASQDHRPTLWVEVDTKGAPQTRTFRMIRTAVALPPGANFVGTFQYCHVIWHIYEVQPVEWTEWPGGDGPPTDTYGKAVDIANVDAADSSPVWTGPAAVADWSTPCRYRFAAEQPDLPL